MRLLLHDTLLTAPYVTPLSEGWVVPTIPAATAPQLFAADLSGDELVLIASAEVAALAETHVAVPDIAVVSQGEGAIAMRVPVRPDEVERSPVYLHEASGTAEILARATLEAFYGIPPALMTRKPSADAQVVIVEGMDAIREPEAGFSEDLCRAWFILTGEPVVTHVCLAPKDADREEVDAAAAQLRALFAVGHTRRKDVRQLHAERGGIERERLTALFAATRFGLTTADRRALTMLLQRGNRGSAYPYAWDIVYLGERTDGG